MAHELFVAQGYEHTTVDQITEAVDVSQRTFFRYFSSKEDVAFALQDETESAFYDAVCARPAGESPMRALRNALDTTWESLGESIQEVVPISVHMRMWHVIETTPALVAVHLRRSTDMEDRLAAVFARREGLPTDDPRPRVLTAAFSGVMRAAGRQWGEGQDVTVDAARRWMETYLDLMGPVLSDDWSRSTSHPGG
ncbi:TetR family transcriptional regulator [Streptomyces sp. JJ36]|uniref:TetR family transcriptional regulator n=1 Tax=Streptomyces sp. JJ36 TaxID=2736645 RepID=UPI001EFFCBB1|nr:TetR family transcriptional regulator [Streptomyces sp. JJ36]MCF6524744.1 TetR family transcriptional regulator [Streptomyces sp. JJ36]